MSSYTYYRFITSRLLGADTAASAANMVMITNLSIHSGTNVYPPRPFVAADISTSNISAFTAGTSTDFCGNITGQSYGNGTYLIKSSSTQYGNPSTPNGYPWNVFDNSGSGTVWYSADGGNSGYSLGIPNNKVVTAVDGINTCGEWVQLQLTTAINITQIVLGINGGNTVRGPSTIVIAGSNNGTTWTNIGRFTNISYTFNTSTLNILNAPSIISINSITISSLNITWSTVTNATSYTLQQSTNNINFIDVSNNIIETSYTVTGLASNTLYYFRIISANSQSSGSTSQSISATTMMEPPATPSIPSTISITNTTITISWTPVPSASSYTIQQSLNNTTFTTIVTGISSPYTITGLSGSTSYYFRIIAVNAGGSSQPSNSLLTSTMENFSIRSSDSTLLLKWIHTTTPSNATNYVIYQNDISYSDLMPIDILPTLQYQSMIIGTNTFNTIINGYYAYYSVQPVLNTSLGTHTSKKLIKALSVYDDIQYDDLKILTPNLITDAIAWYDSADPTRILRDWGGSIINIKNKINPSLYQLDASRNSTSPSPYYKNGYVGTFFGYDINYTYSTDYYLGTYFQCVSGSYFTANGLKLDRTLDSTGNCVVGIVYTSKNTGQAVLWGTDNGSWDRYQFINSPSSSITTGNGSATANVGSSLNVINTPIIYIAALTSNSTSVVRVNGKTDISFNESVRDTGNNLQINAMGDSTKIGTIMVHEVVILKGGNWIMNDVYQLEGYFAHKWGITDKLADNHPYKLIRPYDTTKLTAEEQRFTQDTAVQFTV